MNEKHHDNLCEIAERLGVDAIGFAIQAQALSLSSIPAANREETVGIVAAAYNLLDLLCIALDCEDEVQDMAEQIVAENLAAKA